MCISISAIEYWLIWAVLVCLLIGVLKILVPWILSLAGIGVDGTVARIINMVVVAVVLIAVIIIVFSLLQCVVGGGFSFGRVR